MKTYFELMDMDTANVVGHYESKEDALTQIREVIETHGLEAIEALALARAYDDMPPHIIAEGADLEFLALGKRVRGLRRGLASSVSSKGVDTSYQIVGHGASQIATTWSVPMSKGNKIPSYT